MFCCILFINQNSEELHPTPPPNPDLNLLERWNKTYIKNYIVNWRFTFNVVWRSIRNSLNLVIFVLSSLNINKINLPFFVNNINILLSIEI